MNDYPRTLVVSNNGFSETSNNGRTLGNLFITWPKSKLAQFCISIGEPNYNVCNNYFIITDHEALVAFFKFRKARRCKMSTVINSEGHTSIRGKKSYKTGTKALLRHLVWSNNRWASKDFWRWVNNFSPELVLCYNSDSAFVLNIARSVAKKNNIPLIMFNTEGYFLFKEKYYRTELLIDYISYPIYNLIYKSAYRKFMREVTSVIYLNEKLEEDYKQVFNHRTHVIHTSSSLFFDNKSFESNKYRFVYLGNFGYNRWKALIEVANVLNSIDPSYKLDVYGKADPMIEQKLNACPNIRYNGYISYDAVKDVIYSSTILFHAESKDLQYTEALKYGFTTKIADSISSGHCFVIYSNSEVAGARYIIDTKAGWFAETKDQLKVVINSILNDSKQRTTILENARRIANDNHNLYNNHQKFISIISDSMNAFNRQIH